MIAFIFPGQGSQKVGMGRALAEAFDVATATLDEADTAFVAAGGGSGPSLRELMFHGPDDQLMLTEHTQPAILAASVAASRVLTSRGVIPSFVAGHSLGEYSANVVAGTFALADAIGVVRRRGRYMQEAVPVGTGAMAAILGLPADEVQRACEEAAEGEVVSAANINGAGQVVIAGTAAAVQRACDRAKAHGARRAIPLPVSAPFHCALMKPAEERLTPELRALPTHQPRIPIVANVDAEPKRMAADAIEALVRQVSAPVLWESVVHRLAAAGVKTFIEVGPGTVLSGLVRKIQRDARVLSFAAPDDFAEIEQHVLQDA
jgi:[acyl-carrier-protein] S-malonyltransferase